MNYFIDKEEAILNLNQQIERHDPQHATINLNSYLSTRRYGRTLICDEKASGLRGGGVKKG